MRKRWGVCCVGEGRVDNPYRQLSESGACRKGFSFASAFRPPFFVFFVASCESILRLSHPPTGDFRTRSQAEEIHLHLICESHITSYDIEFDADKDEINRFKHRLPLAFGSRVFDDGLCQILPSFRPIDGEDRYKAVGMVEGKLYTAVYVHRGAHVRMISVRRSNASEQRDYDSDPS